MIAPQQIEIDESPRPAAETPRIAGGAGAKSLQSLDAPESADSAEPAPLTLKEDLTFSIEQAALNSSVNARSARDTFSALVDCMKDGDLDTAQTYLGEVRDRLSELWDYVDYRASPFRSLLGAIDAAIRFRDVGDLDDSQTDALHDALKALPKSFLSQADVTHHIRAFAMVRLDIVNPVFGAPDKGLRIKVERD